MMKMGLRSGLGGPFGVWWKGYVERLKDRKLNPKTKQASLPQPLNQTLFSSLWENQNPFVPFLTKP
jgi:hypothetical protein